MKKLLLTTLIAAAGLSLTACKKDKETIKLLTPSGTPLMAVGNLINDKGLEVEAVSGPDNLVAGLSTKSHDIIIAPLTAGAKLAIAGKSSYKLEAVVTTNNTYIISKKNTTLTDINDLKGKKIVAYGQNNTPDIALKNALKTNSIAESEVEITYENDVTTATSTFMGGSDFDFCLIAEPQITALRVNKKAELNVLDLSSYMSTTIYQAGIFVNPDANQSRCNSVIKDIKKNIEYLNEKPAEYAKEVLNKNQFFTKMGEEVLAKSIPNANISFIKAKDNKDKILAYYTEVNNYNAKILNGMVTDEFFR
ncbi:MAG: ABC transporter substrate-binding protein [Acholeplasmatales bacterium]|nr:ABC transporter substrate-binding protein [Acholeplasmatales bacterium]